MRRLRLVLALGLGGATGCGSVGTEGRGEPTPPPVVAPPAAIETTVEPVPEPEPEPELEPEPEPEPEPAPEPPWGPDDEPRILAVQDIVAEAARVHGVDPYLVNGVIWVESKFRPKARNRSGARGLMQLMPTTAKAIGRALKRTARVYDPDFNVHAGTWYLARMIDKFHGNEAHALAAYVRGPAKIRAWLDEGHPFPDSVRGFVDKVERARRAFEARGWPEPEVGGDLPAPGPEASPSTPPSGS